MRGDSVFLIRGLGGERAQQYAEGAVSFLVSALRQSVRGELHLRAARFRHSRPRTEAAIEGVLQCPISFDAPRLELEFARADLALPMKRADAVLHKLMGRFVAERLALLPDPRDSVLIQARRFLFTELPRGNATVEALADHLQLGVRTLQRRLEAEGSSFAAILDEARRELTMKLLCDPRIRLIDLPARPAIHMDWS